jgi:hypothetical protein
MWGVLCGDVSWTAYQSTLHNHTERHAHTSNVCCHIAIMDLL